jgi:ribosomal protein L7/L12
MEESTRITALEIKVAELQRRLDFVMQHLGVQYAEPGPSPAMAQVAALLRQGNKIEAINVYRAITGAGLREAKTAVEELEASLR